MRYTHGTEEAQRDFEQDIITEFEYWRLYINDNQSYLGRTYLALRRGDDEQEVDPFADTTEAEKSELTIVMSSLKVVLDELYQPARINYANLRNLWHHCHWHVVPRYEGEDYGLRTAYGMEFRDYNPGKNYAPVPALEVPEQVLFDIKKDIADGLASLPV